MRSFPKAPFVASPVIALVVGLTACTSYRTARDPGNRRPSSTRLDSIPHDVDTTRDARLPWELWMPGRDSEGRQLQIRGIIVGDEHFQRQEYDRALAEYASINQKDLSESDREAVIMRLGSAQLALDQAPKALSTVSDYFRIRGIDAKDVPAPFALLLGYGYGRKGQLDQSLAWFSRAHRLMPSGSGADAADQGVRALLRSLPTVQFESIGQTWTHDEFVRPLLGFEQKRRSQLRGDERGFNPRFPFWTQGQDESVARVVAQTEEPQRSQIPLVGVLLPLTGKFGALGVSIQHGIELASTVAAPTDHAAPYKVIFKDTAGEPARAAGLARELAEIDHASFILGPLISEEGAAASDAARQVGVPMMTFSKSENFKAGQGIFRLGATVSSQVSSLLDFTYGNFGFSRFAIIHPESQSGREFADVFRREAQSRGMEIVLDRSYNGEDQALFIALAKELEGTSAQAVFLPDSIQTSATFLSLMGDRERARIRPLGTALWDNFEKLQNSKAIFEGALFVSPYFALSGKPMVSRFNDTYEGRYGQKPNFLAAQGFDAMTLIGAALKQRSEQSSSIETSLGRISRYDGLTGSITPNSNGELKRDMSVVQMQKGQLVELAQVSAPSYVYRGDDKQDAAGSPRADGTEVR